MLLNGFAGRTVRQVERFDESLRILFADGGILYVRAKGPPAAFLKLTCACTKCIPSQCEKCRGVELAASD